MERIFGDEVGSTNDDETSSSDGDVSDGDVSDGDVVAGDASDDEIHIEGPSSSTMSYKDLIIISLCVFSHKIYNLIYTVITVTYTKAKCLRILTTIILPFSHMMINYGTSRVDRNAIQK